MSKIYAYAITKCGLARVNNEDNFFLSGKCLPEIHRDASMHACGETLTAAVMDGMGGEYRGELASYTAAKGFPDMDKNPDDRDPDDICRDLNRKVLEAGKGMPFIGTTLAAVMFRGDKAVCFNVGDSRIYLHENGNLKQVSTDHVRQSPWSGTAELTQCLGIPEKEFIIQPSVFTAGVRAGQKWLLCSDGLSSVITDTVINNILGMTISLEEKASRLMTKVYEKGAPDNVTMILCERR